MAKDRVVDLNWSALVLRGHGNPRIRPCNELLVHDQGVRSGRFWRVKDFDVKSCACRILAHFAPGVSA